MQKDRYQLGREGEEMAAQYLQAQGYEIVATRFRVREGEVDLVAVERDRCAKGGAARGDTLVFVEVRARRSDLFGGAVESVDARKLARLSWVAQRYLAQYNWRGDFRIDVIGIEWPPEGGPSKIDHLKDVS